MSFAEDYLTEAREVLTAVAPDAVERLAGVLAEVRSGEGRVFVLGVGGAAALAAMATLDLRKSCGVQAYAATDSVAELSARTNDEGWESVFEGWLRVSKLGAGDALLILSVGGGNKERGVSVNLVHAIDLARRSGAVVTGVVGDDKGYTAEQGQAVVVVPPLFPARKGAHTLGVAALVLKLVVSHPRLML